MGGGLISVFCSFDYNIMYILSGMSVCLHLKFCVSFCYARQVMSSSFSDHEGGMLLAYESEVRVGLRVEVRATGRVRVSIGV